MSITLLVAPCLLAGEPAATERYDYAIPNKPAEIVTADFNLDGNTDIAVLNNKNMNVFYGLGAGAFAKWKTVATGRWPDAIVTSDWNADGRPDAAVMNFYGVRVFTGRANGKLKRCTGLVVHYVFMSLATGDFNQDDILDLAVGQITFHGGAWGVDHAEYYVLVFDGVGNGKFTNRLRYRVAKPPSEIVTGDFDGDGLTDVAVGTGATAGGLNILYGRAGGGFADAAVCPSPATYAMVCADFNDDGRLDIALVDALDDEVALLYGEEGGFAAPVAYAVDGVHAAIALGDFNADALLDIAVARGDADGFATILYGQEGGGFGQATDYPVGLNPSGIAAADSSGDGLLDLVVSNNASRSISVLLNAGDEP